MADRTLTINHADGGSETYTINRDKFAGVREMQVDGAAVTVDHTAVPKHQSKETTLGGSQSITIKRDIEPLLSKVVGGAAAAYSLRDLHDTTGVNKVVRVRRESDNNERDFNAKEVSNGTLQNWTNAQVTPPLDVRELTATGRDGAVIEAAAAYSLRNLSDSYTGSVVEVRRSSDDAVRSFTAAEVADGTLTDWVSEALIAQNSTSNPYTTFTNASTTEFTATLSSGVSFAGFGNVEGSSGDSVTVSFDLNIVSGSPRLALRASSSSIPDVSNGVSYTSSGSYSLTMFATGDFGFIGFSEGDSPSEFTVSNFKITSVSGATYVRDGTVSKWYDQSTTSGVPNAKHAVQTDAAYQPKIVDGGALVTNAEGNPAIQGATGKSFGLSAITGLEDVSIFFVGAVPPSFEAITGWDTNLHMIRFSSSTWEFVANTTDPGNMGWNSALTSGDTALFNFTRSSGTVTGYTNSVASATTSNANSNPFGLNRIFTRSNVNYNDYKGKASELIIYPSNQTANRTALEANIGEVYGIAGIPAYDDTVNGFVETWYDQSGNGNNATQLTASNQPRIVIDGELIINAKGFPSIAQYRGGAGTNVNRSFVINNGLPVLNSTHFAVTQYNRQFSYHLIGTASAGSSRVGRYSSDQFRIAQGGTSATSGAVFPTSVVKLATVNNAASGGTTTGFVDGVQAFSANLADPSSTGLVYKYLFRGDNDSSGPLLYSEFIYYSSDQSANRPAIEANINNQYEIY
jgi:hypothetical protein